MGISYLLSASGRSGDTFDIVAIIIGIIWLGYIFFRLVFPFLYFVFSDGSNSTNKRGHYTKEDKQRFFNLVNQVSSKAVEAVERLETFFKPNKRVEQSEVDAFLAEYSDVDSVVKEIYRGNYKDNDVLRTKGIQAFHEKVNPSNLVKLLKSNQTVFDSIQMMKQLSESAIASYNTLFSSNHYCTHSEMENYLSSTAQMEDFATLLLPQYDDHIPFSVKDIVFKRKGIATKRKKHNEEFISKELEDNKAYFDTVLGQYPLDPQQRDSIVKLEDNCLVIASAGSGKTSTILGKAKYLLEKRNIDPSKLLLITYTKKAANELHERIKIDGITSCTFHKLAKDIIGQVTGQSPSIAEADVPLNVFHRLIETNHDFLHAVNNYVINQQSLMGLEHEYSDAFSYFEDRRKYGIQALFPDVDGKIIFTRSEEEKRLVSILTRLGVPFRYENLYQYDTRTPERRMYRPDFTIYYLVGTEWKWLYLEHFAIDAVGNVPQWFGEGTRGGWRVANQKYKDGIQWKRSTHQKYGTILIETTSADFWYGTVETKLREQLARYGVPINERTDEELYELLVKRSRKLEKSVYTLIQSFVTLMKANEKTVDGLIKDVQDRIAKGTYSDNDIRSNAILTNVIKPFYEEYQRELDMKYEIDFTDCIIQATALCRQGLWKRYDYILVDEFQDISVDRYKFLQALRKDKPKTKLFCVGDDWQSIFRFAGSDMSLFYEFENYFGYTEQCKIETTYRFHQPLIDKSSEFILKNKEQKEKTIKPLDNDKYKTYLNFVKCDGEEEDGVLKKVEEIVSSIPTTQSILLLGRYNYDAMSVGFKGKIGMKDDRIMVKVGGRDLQFLSVHSAKGLEADIVILVNCNQGAYGFPSLIEDDPILDFVLSKSETYPYAEERRLFYVAMTRARMRMYVLYDQKRPSPFISEFLLKVEIGSYLCPRCLDGKMEAIKDGITEKGDKYRIFVCSNRESGCDFFETKYGDLTPPGIKITEDMTAQDIEKLREARRSARTPRVSNAPQTNFSYGTQAPIFQHNPIGGFNKAPIAAPFPPQQIIDEPKEESADDLPF